MRLGRRVSTIPDHRVPFSTWCGMRSNGTTLWLVYYCLGWIAIGGTRVSSFSLRPMARQPRYERRSTSRRMEAASGTPLSFDQVQAVIFDIDGTLADSGQLGFDATQVILQKYGYPSITHDDYCAGTRYTTPERLARHVGLTPEDANYHELGQQMGRDFDNLYIDLVSLETASLYPGIYDLVRRIPDHVKVGALTNAAERYAHAVFTVNTVGDDTFSLYQRFGSIRGADTVPQPKPFADGLWQVCRELSVDLDPATCVYIGDSPSDGQAATAAGMPAIGVTWGAHSAESLQPHVSVLCHSVSELAALLPQE